MTPTASDVRATLALLGDSPPAIAETLAAKGITGKRGYAMQCPLAAWLKSQYPEHGVQVGQHCATVGGVVVDLDEAQSVFVVCVDQFGYYPELIA